MKRSGFSLIEVNMAVFVLSIGVLSMAVLYPLGLRESIQSQADLKQSMFADFVLNVAVAAASNPDVTRAQWNSTFQVSGEEGSYLSMSEDSNHFVVQAVASAVAQYEGFKGGHKLFETYAIYCTRVAGTDRIMSIMVRSLDMDTSNMSSSEMKKRLASQPFYYAEAFYQGAQ